MQRSSRTTFENKGKKERKEKRQFNNNLKEEVTRMKVSERSPPSHGRKKIHKIINQTIKMAHMNMRKQNDV